MNTQDETFHILNISHGTIKEPFLLQGKIFSIGREKHNSIVIPSLFVSRTHALLIQIMELESRQTKFKIVDGDQYGRRSVNGLSIDGKNFKSRMLEHGDRIALGSEVAIHYEILSMPSANFIRYFKYKKAQEIKEKTEKNSRQTLIYSHYFEDRGKMPDLSEEDELTLIFSD